MVTGAARYSGGGKVMYDLRFECQEIQLPNLSEDPAKVALVLLMSGKKNEGLYSVVLVRWLVQQHNYLLSKYKEFLAQGNGCNPRHGRTAATAPSRKSKLSHAASPSDLLSVSAEELDSLNWISSHVKAVYGQTAEVRFDTTAIEQSLAEKFFLRKPELVENIPIFQFKGELLPEHLLEFSALPKETLDQKVERTLRQKLREPRVLSDVQSCLELVMAFLKQLGGGANPEERLDKFLRDVLNMDTATQSLALLCSDSLGLQLKHVWALWKLAKSLDRTIPASVPPQFRRPLKREQKKGLQRLAKNISKEQLRVLARVLHQFFTSDIFNPDSPPTQKLNDWLQAFEVLQGTTWFEQYFPNNLHLSSSVAALEFVFELLDVREKMS